MVAEREEKILNQVLDRKKIKHEVLLVDTVYDWYPKGVQDFSKNQMEDDPKDDMELRSNGKVLWRGQEQGFWYKLEEDEFIFQANNDCHRMKYD